MFGRLAAGNDGFQEDFLIVLDERNEVGLVLNHDDGDLLSWISLLIRVFKNINLVPELDIQDHIFEGNAPFCPEKIILLRIPRKDFHPWSLAQRVPFVFFLANLTPGPTDTALERPSRIAEKVQIRYWFWLWRWLGDFPFSISLATTGIK
ncbi:MAG: hypothetical protein WAK53_05185 [Chromatiaceae bacterium]